MTHLDKWAKKIAKKRGFRLGQRIYQGEYYSPGFVRNVIYQINYQSKPSILKLYDDPRMSDEPVSLKAAAKLNRTKKLLVPQVYAFEMVSPKKGWLIMERLPKDGYFLKSPLKTNQKPEFISLYLDYRLNFPQKPSRPLTLSEKLPAHEFHTFRIKRWFQLANDREAERLMRGEKIVLQPKEFIPRYEKALKIIRQEFSKRKMIWCHGHFKPHEIFKVPDRDIYYLTDFAHSKMYPEGYELGFIIWADHLMSANWQKPYQLWHQGIDEWLEALEPVKKALKINRFNQLLKASLLERSIGTVLADITATERPIQEKIARIRLLYRLINSLI